MHLQLTAVGLDQCGERIPVLVPRPLKQIGQRSGTSIRIIPLADIHTDTGGQQNWSQPHDQFQIHLVSVLPNASKAGGAKLSP